MPAQSLSGSVIAIPPIREHGIRSLGTAVVVAAILHVAFALYLSMPHKTSGGGAGGATVDMENVNFSDNTQAPEAPSDMSYRPEVANLPEAQPAGGGDDASGADNSAANAKIDASAIDADAGGGEALKIGGGKGLDDLLALPKAGGGTGKGVGYRIKTYPPTVPFYKVEVKPKPVNLPVPDYPPSVREAGIEGNAVIEALLDLDGSVMDARVQKSSGNGMLDEAAVNAALKAKFTPAMQRDKPVRVWISIPYRFSLT